MAFELEWRPFPSPQGPLHFAAVPWDAETFAHPIYALACDELHAAPLRRHLPALLDRLSIQRPVLVWAKLSNGTVELARALSGLGFYAVETLLQPHVSLDRFRAVVPPPDALRLRSASEADLPALRAIARSAFRADRYHVDPNLSSERADERYVRWIERGMEDAEPVLVYEDATNGVMLGFYHLRETAANPKTIYLSLGAIDPRHHGRGFGLLLHQAVLFECKARGYQVAETHISANNVAQINVFARLGSSFRDPKLTLHWYGGASGERSN
jgi:RimJ/RimL family protein N-acetyltransferase